MTKSCCRVNQQQSNYFVNLHDFLKTKRGIVKYAKKTFPTNNWNDSVKHTDERFSNLTVDEFHGSFWVGDQLLRKRGSDLIYLAKNNRAPTNPNSKLPTEIVVKSCLVEFSSSIRREKEVILNLAPCPNVVKCYGDEITATKSGDLVYNLLFEHCSGSSLRDHIINFGLNGLPESEIRSYTKDILNGLYYMHCNFKARYIHGDIKPRNIFLKQKEGSFVAKLGSFGMAEKLSPEVLRDQEMGGAGPYISPELARDGYLDWPADIWALGCVVLHMFTGKLPWSFEDANEFLLDSCNDEIPEIPNGISSLGRDFINKCLVRSPYKRRPTWLLIKHPFVC